METRAPAKINLFLHVLGRRSDGYHELKTLMCAIGLYDTLLLDVDSGRNTITCSDPNLACDESNLALKAALVFNDAMADEKEMEPGKVSIHLTKRIPVGAGLGGGSSDAAAVLKALNHYHGYPFSRERLLAMALDLGADVPFFIVAQPAIATGVGEVLSPYHGLPPYGVVVVYPGFGISTAEVFKNLNLGLTKCEKQLRYFPFKQGILDMERHLCNDLESVAIRQFPVIEEIKKELSNQGAKGTLMTGSGSAVYGIYADMPTAHKAADTMQKPAQWQVFVAEVLC